MFWVCFALGALAGAFLPDRRALSTVFPVGAILIFVGLRDHVFAEWSAGLLWYFGTFAAFEVGLALGGIGRAYLHRLWEDRRLETGADQPPAA